MPTILLSSYELYKDSDGIERARRKEITSVYPWLDAELLQGGESGLVFSPKGNYTTAFIEAFIDGTFIRGEGKNLVEAEYSAWEKYLARNECPQHEWSPRNYKNGAGFCIHCNTFKSYAFTGEELGQFCHDCGVGTTYSWDFDKEKEEFIFGCELHVVESEALKRLKADIAEDTANL